MASDRSGTDVFALLSDETRLDVLRTVAVAQHEQRETGVAALSFSEIYERVDADNTAKLSYHLGELTGTFVRKREDGYAFTHAGEQLIRFVLAENYQAPPDVGPIETDGQCTSCGASALRATLDDQYFFVRCADCEQPAFAYRVRPAQVRSRSGAELLEAVVREQAGDFLKMRHGVCPDCAGRIDTEIRDTSTVEASGPVPATFATFSDCRQCLRCLSVPLAYAAAYHPAAIAFHWRHGLDVTRTGIWELHEYLADGRWTATRVDDGDAAYRVTMRAEDDTLRLFLDEEAAVRSTERVRRSGPSESR